MDNPKLNSQANPASSSLPDGAGGAGLRALIVKWRATSQRWRDDDETPYACEWADTLDECANELEAALSALPDVGEARWSSEKANQGLREGSTVPVRAPEATPTERVPSAWAEWGDGHDYSRTGKHDPNECRMCLNHVIQRLEAQPFADRMVKAEERAAALVSIAKRATNGWACYAKRKVELDEIARLHEAIGSNLRGVDGGPSAQPKTDMPANPESPPEGVSLEQIAERIMGRLALESVMDRGAILSALRAAQAQGSAEAEAAWREEHDQHRREMEMRIAAEQERDALRKERDEAVAGWQSEMELRHDESLLLAKGSVAFQHERPREE